MLTDLRIYLSQVDIPQPSFPIDLWNNRAYYWTYPDQLPRDYMRPLF